MSISVLKSPSATPANIPITYFQKDYLSTQTYNNYLAYKDSSFFFPLDIQDKKAISIPKSPFGSILKSNDGNLSEFLQEIKKNLSSSGIETLLINHPISIYDTFVEKEVLKNEGFNTSYEDLSQVIEINDDWEASIHSMQKRKLKSLIEEGFYLRKMEPSEWKTAHKFLTVCRQAQGLQINIEWEKLERLVTTMPKSYDCFGVFREDKISAICISVNVDESIAYYYLPATSPLFRTHSPMVLLIAGMVDYYRKKKFKYIDLGVSSILGKPQETLMLFKERMGAKTYLKPTLTLAL